MRIEAVTICVGYSDFLAEVVPFNRPHLARWLIVTSPKDLATRELCRNLGMECLATDDFYRGGAPFDKARAVDRGLQQLAGRDWVLHLDGDIALPRHFGESLEDADPDPECLYGCDRFTVTGRARWEALKASGFLDRYSRCAHHNVCFPGGHEVGARWADTTQGYVPIGFFQLWHGSSSAWRGLRSRRYPCHGHGDAARTDVQFGLLWDRRKRALLPEVVVAHLESARAAVGANWSGRTTPAFDAPAPCPGPS